MHRSLIGDMFRSRLSGDDDYSQFGDYGSYDPQEDEGETFAFESNFEKNQQQMKEQEKPAASFSLADGFPEVRDGSSGAPSETDHHSRLSGLPCSTVLHQTRTVR